MQKRSAAPEQARRNNERQGGVPYNRLAEDMAQPLADLRVPGVNNESGPSDDAGIENETETLPGPRELLQGRHRRQIRTPYQQLAAEMAVPLAEVQVPGASNAGETSSDERVKSEVGNRGDVTPVDQRETKRRGLNHYVAVAADIAGSLAKVRGPAMSNERDSECPQTDRQSIESSPQQESLSEYNPDASCGSVSCRYSISLLDTHSERETEAYEDQDIESVAEQESLSEYNENASCGSGFHRPEYSISDYQTRVQTTECESANQENFAADCGAFCSKSPYETYTAQEDCYSQVDGEPFSKRTKPNPEVAEELSLPRSSYAKSWSVGDAQFESSPEACSVDSKLKGSLPVQGDEENTRSQNIEQHSRASNVSSLDSRLTSQFEHMNLADNSVETGASFDPSAESSGPISQSNPEPPKKDEDGYAVWKSTDSSVVENDFASCSTNADSANVSTTSVLSQGARPKTRPNVPSTKKHKPPKQNTKNAYTELAKVVAGDLSAMNSQINNSHAKTHRGDDERKSVKRQELFDGSTIETATSDTPSEREQRGASQQTSLINKDRTRGSDVVDVLNGIAGSRATSRRKLTAEAAAQHRSQVEEQQRSIDNMAPELQAMVIEMMQRDEEERGGHVHLSMPLNPSVLPRGLPQGRGGNANQGAWAEGALNQAGNKKSRKGPKGKGHYVELAGIIAPQLAAMNASMVNGHTKGELGAAGHHNHNGIADIADEEPLDQKPGTSAVDTTGARGTDTRLSDHLLSNGCAGTSSRDQSRAHISLPPAAANGIETTDGRGTFSVVDSSRTPSQRRENENRRKYH